MKRIKELILKSKLASVAYKTKFYIDVGVEQVAWISNKGPDLMAIVYFTEKIFDIVLNGPTIVNLIIAGLLSLFLLGMFMKKSGLYDVEQYVQADKNPVQKELLEAARRINK